MRVFKDYEDFLENKNDGENGVSQESLNNYYAGDIKKAEDDNISNKGCFDCVKCVMCENCIRCAYLANCYYCFDQAFGCHLTSVGNRH